MYLASAKPYMKWFRIEEIKFSSRLSSDSSSSSPLAIDLRDMESILETESILDSFLLTESLAVLG